MVRGKKIKREREKKEDKLSDMPDCVLHHILSFVNFKEVVQTCVLSKRWEHVWKCVPSIILHCSQAMTKLDFKNFKNFVSKVLSLRDKKVALNTIDFKHHGGYVKASFLGKLISEAISNDAKQLLMYAETDIKELPPTILSPIFSSQTLTSLKVSVYDKNKSGGRIMFPKSGINVPLLRSLFLVNIEFCADGDEDHFDPFSNMNRLSVLVIKYCTLKGANTLHISSPMLSNLTIHSRDSSINEFVLSTRNPSSFTFDGVPLLTLSGNGLAYVEKVYIDAYTNNNSLQPPLMLLEWLEKFTHVQSLTVTANTLQVLSFIPDFMNMDHLSMGNLKSLIVKMKKNSPPTVPDSVLKFLLQNSPWAKVSITKRPS
ncbi:unnamed protein product [Lupinus luteus]|uniref:F-box domain-containing protein n=1 Tax=Lupinus luteus TaxID=3873 RepID=A0AAV1W8N2_LUPLU